MIVENTFLCKIFPYDAANLDLIFKIFHSIISLAYHFKDSSTTVLYISFKTVSNAYTIPAPFNTHTQLAECMVCCVFYLCSQCRYISFGLMVGFFSFFFCFVDTFFFPVSFNNFFFAVSICYTLSHFRV